MNAFLLLFCFAVVQTNDQLISQLGSDDKATASAAYDLLESRGVDACPALVLRLDDKTNANYDAFHNPDVMVKTNRNWAIYKPKVGDVIFFLIQRQIEGSWPKGFQHHYALTHRNAKNWLTKHKGLTLRQLQLLATTDSLSSVARKIAANPHDDVNSKCLAFLTERLAKIQCPNRER